ncbi:MAG: hypothetical protein JST81_13545 [Bacteroidetes bacterium]|nr:hypothetical protein [Bacteroidota bacterium]
MVTKNANKPTDQPLKKMNKTEAVDPNCEEQKKSDEQNDEDTGYTILPSNDAGITADDNAATGKLHQREGD